MFVTLSVQSKLKIYQQAELWPAERMTPLLDEVQQLCNIVGKSIVTAKGNQQKPNGLYRLAKRFLGNRT